eukprot:5344617-Prymnesium_polylepis.1
MSQATRDPNTHDDDPQAGCAPRRDRRSHLEARKRAAHQRIGGPLRADGSTHGQGHFDRARRALPSRPDRGQPAQPPVPFGARGARGLLCDAPSPRRRSHRP